MNEDFVTYELAVKLKEKGFREECLCHYVGEDLVYNIESPITNNQLWFSHNKFDNIWHRDNYDAPTISQVLKWLREEKKIHIVIDFDGGMNWYYQIALYGLTTYEKESEHKYNSYEQSAVAGIEYILDNLI